MTKHSTGTDSYNARTRSKSAIPGLLCLVAAAFVRNPVTQHGIIRGGFTTT